MDFKTLAGIVPLILPFGSCTVECLFNLYVGLYLYHSCLLNYNMIKAGVMAGKVLCKGYLVLCGDVDQVQLKKTKDSW